MISTAVVNHVVYIEIAVTNIGHLTLILFYTLFTLYHCSIHCNNSAFAATRNKPLFIINAVYVDDGRVFKHVL